MRQIECLYKHQVKAMSVLHKTLFKIYRLYTDIFGPGSLTKMRGADRRGSVLRKDVFFARLD